MMSSDAQTKVFSSQNKQPITNIISTQVFRQIVSNSWCNNTESSLTTVFSLCAGLKEFCIVGLSQHHTALDRSNWMTCCESRQGTYHGHN